MLKEGDAMKIKNIIEKLTKIALVFGVQISKKGKYKYEGKVICDNLIIPSIQKNVIELNGTYKELEFTCYNKNKMLQEKITCLAKDIDRRLFEMLLNTFGLDIFISSNKKDKNLLLDVIKSTRIFLKEVDVYDYIGWTKINNKNVYIDSLGIISSNRKLNNKKIELTKKFNEEFGILKTEVKEKKAYLYALGMLDIGEDDVTFPLLFFSLASVINTPLKSIDIEMKFILWIYGKTGKRKTSLANAFFGFADLVDNKIHASFLDTSNSIQYFLNLFRDRVVCVDDFHPATNGKEWARMMDTVSIITRNVGNGSGRNRLQKDLSLFESFDVAGNVAVTSETLFEAESAMARMFVVEVKEKSINLKKFQEFQDNTQIYAAFMRHYIRDFSNKYETSLYEMKIYYSKRRHELSNLKLHGRVIEQIVQFELMIKSFLEYGLRKKFISEIDANKLEQRMRKVLENYGDKMNKLLAQEDPIYLYFSTLFALIDSNNCSLLLKGTKKGNRRNIVGWEDNNFFYLNAIVIYKEVQSYLSVSKKIFPQAMKLFHKEMSGQNIIKKSKDGNTFDYTQKVDVEDNGKRVRVLVVNKKVLNLYINNLGDDFSENMLKENSLILRDLKKAFKTLYFTIDGYQFIIFKFNKSVRKKFKEKRLRKKVEIYE